MKLSESTEMHQPMTIEDVMKAVKDGKRKRLTSRDAHTYFGHRSGHARFKKKTMTREERRKKRKLERKRRKAGRQR